MPEIIGVVALPALTVAGTAAPVLNQGAGAVTLPMFVPAIDVLSGGTINSLTGDVTLPFLVVAGGVGAPQTAFDVGVTLPHLRVHGRVRVGVQVQLFTGPVRQFGSTTFTFLGPPSRSIAWSLVGGSGTLTPLSTFTDLNGVAFCRYEPGDFVGEAEIGVSYVT